MNNVLILSDSHGLRNEIKTIVNRHEIKNIIHCGDSELNTHAAELEGLIVVSGNCDIGAPFPLDETLHIDGLNFFITHGHLYDVRSSLMKLSYRAAEGKAHIVCFGHTHIAGAEKIDNQLFINPGSIRYPKKREEKTYAIIQWNTLDEIQVNFYTTDGIEVHDLAYKTSI